MASSLSVAETAVRREAFCKAAANGKIADLRRRLQDGHDPNDLGPHSRSALQMAAHRGRNEVCRLLLAAKADVIHRDVHGWTCLHDAAAYGRSGDLVLMLLQAGADKHAETRKGLTPLDMALQQGKSAAAAVKFIEGWDLDRDMDDCAQQLDFDRVAEPHLDYIARELVTGALPDGWIELAGPVPGEPTGERHYQNLLTGEQLSQHPLLEAARAEVGDARLRHRANAKAKAHRFSVACGDVLTRWRAFVRRAKRERRNFRRAGRLWRRNLLFRAWMTWLVVFGASEKDRKRLRKLKRKADRFRNRLVGRRALRRWHRYALARASRKFPERMQAAEFRRRTLVTGKWRFWRLAFRLSREARTADAKAVAFHRRLLLPKAWAELRYATKSRRHRRERLLRILLDRGFMIHPFYVDVASALSAACTCKSWNSVGFKHGWARCLARLDFSFSPAVTGDTILRVIALVSSAKRTTVSPYQKVVPPTSCLAEEFASATALDSNNLDNVGPQRRPNEVSRVSLRSLDLSGCSAVGDELIVRIFSRSSSFRPEFRELQTLALACCGCGVSTTFGARGVSCALSACPSLTCLDVRGLGTSLLARDGGGGGGALLVRVATVACPNLHDIRCCNRWRLPAYDHRIAAMLHDGSRFQRHEHASCDGALQSLLSKNMHALPPSFGAAPLRSRVAFLVRRRPKREDDSSCIDSLLRALGRSLPHLSRLDAASGAYAGGDCAASPNAILDAVNQRSTQLQFVDLSFCLALRASELTVILVSLANATNTAPNRGREGGNDNSDNRRPLLELNLHMAMAASSQPCSKSGSCPPTEHNIGVLGPEAWGVGLWSSLGSSGLRVLDLRCLPVTNGDVAMRTIIENCPFLVDLGTSWLLTTNTFKSIASHLSCFLEALRIVVIPTVPDGREPRYGPSLGALTCVSSVCDRLHTLELSGEHLVNCTSRAGGGASTVPLIGRVDDNEGTLRRILTSVDVRRRLLKLVLVRCSRGALPPGTFFPLLHGTAAEAADRTLNDSRDNISQSRGRILEECSALRILEVRQCDGFNDDCLLDVLVGCRRISELRLISCAELTASSVLHCTLRNERSRSGFCGSFARQTMPLLLTSLRQLEIEECSHFNPDAVRGLCSDVGVRTSLNRVRLANMPHLPSDVVQSVLALPRLEHAELHRVAVNDAAFRALERSASARKRHGGASATVPFNPCDFEDSACSSAGTSLVTLSVDTPTTSTVTAFEQNPGGKNRTRSIPLSIGAMATGLAACGRFRALTISGCERRRDDSSCAKPPSSLALCMLRVADVLSALVACGRYDIAVNHTHYQNGICLSSLQSSPVAASFESEELLPLPWDEWPPRIALESGRLVLPPARSHYHATSRRHTALGYEFWMAQQQQNDDMGKALIGPRRSKDDSFAIAANTREPASHLCPSVKTGGALALLHAKIRRSNERKHARKEAGVRGRVGPSVLLPPVALHPIRSRTWGSDDGDDTGGPVIGVVNGARMESWETTKKDGHAALDARIKELLRGSEILKARGERKPATARHEEIKERQGL